MFSRIGHHTHAGRALHVAALLILPMLLGLIAAEGISSNDPRDHAFGLPPNPSWGTNLHEVADWSSEWPFIDAFKTARPWISGGVHTWDDGQELDLDEHGWVRSLQPGQIAHTLMFRQGPHYPGGKYHVLYEGEGRLDYRFAAQKIDAESVPGHDVVFVEPSEDGINLRILETNPDNYLRNIRVCMPGGIQGGHPRRYAASAEDGDGGFTPLWRLADSHIFHPLFLQRLEGYGVIRFMDWMHTNWSPVKDWDDRPERSDAVWSTKAGVPVEVMCALANALQAKPWFTLPHQATDAFVVRFAETVRAELAEPLEIYVEYSNEVWNGGFGQAKYAQEKGTELALDTEDPYRARAYYYAQRTREVHERFIEGLGSAQRVVRVVASQAANPGLSRQILDYKDLYKHADALAIAPYFGHDMGKAAAADEVANMPLYEFFAQLEQEALPQSIDWMRKQAVIARERGLQLIAYEGGQHLVGVGEAREHDGLRARLTQANRDPRMGALYDEYLEAWQALDAGVFVHFLHCGHYTKWGCWGSLEYMSQPESEAPKFHALRKVLQATQPAPAP